jgi:hypothetical protein
MTVRQPRYSKEEFAERGHALYESQIRSPVKDGNHVPDEQPCVQV